MKKWILAPAVWCAIVVGAWLFMVLVEVVGLMIGARWDWLAWTFWPWLVVTMSLAFYGSWKVWARGRREERDRREDPNYYNYHN